MKSDEIEAAENRGETIFKIDKQGNWIRDYPDFQTCNLCHRRLPITDLNEMCSPPRYWCKECALKHVAKDFPDSKMVVTL